MNWFLFCRTNDGMLIGPFASKSEGIAFADRWLDFEDVIGSYDEDDNYLQWDILQVTEQELASITEFMNSSSCPEPENWPVIRKTWPIDQAWTSAEWIDHINQFRSNAPELFEQ